MDEEGQELPEDCWAIIATQLGDYHQLESLSLVSKKLLAVTNQVRVSLKVIHPSIELLSKQLQRFLHVKRIDLSNFAGSLQKALVEISRSGLNLEELNISTKSDPVFMLLKDLLGTKLKNIRVFKCAKSCLTNSDLVVLADSFPSIEELDISQQRSQEITDEGICAISLKLKNLRKIDLTGNRNVSDQSLIALSSNCKFLTEIVLRYCYNVSQNGINFAMENCHRYNSLVYASNAFFLREITNLLNFSPCLSTIDLYFIRISDEFLDGIVRARIPLKNLHLSTCMNFTFGALYQVLKAYPSLESLDLSKVEFLTDKYVISICPFISKLITIKLKNCRELTCSTFIAITSSCPAIINIEMSFLPRSCINLDNSLSSPKNRSVTSVFLPRVAIKPLLHICPNLQVLTVCGILDSEELDVAFILKCCHDLRHLTLIYCCHQRLKFDDERGNSKLEWFSAKCSGINDRELARLGRRCPDLRHLDLEKCRNVTVKGVKQVIKRCKKLKYVNLNSCSSVKKEVVGLMVDSSRSLRQIMTPGRPTDHTESEIEDFLKQGCLVIPGGGRRY